MKGRTNTCDAVLATSNGLETEVVCYNAFDQRLQVIAQTVYLSFGGEYLSAS